MTTLFYNTLNEVEKLYWKKLMALFAKVDPKKPEIGCQVLIERARAEAEKENTTVDQTLERTYQAAKTRTEKRLALLFICDPEQQKNEPNDR